MSFENHLIIPNDILKLILSNITSFRHVFRRIRLVCRRWRKVVVEMMHTNNEKWMLPWMLYMCKFLAHKRRVSSLILGSFPQDAYNLLSNYLSRTTIETNGFNMNTGYARKCRCGLIMVFCKSKNEVSCTNVACCFKQQFALTFNMCLCKNDLHVNQMHADAFFEELLRGVKNVQETPDQC